MEHFRSWIIRERSEDFWKKQNLLKGSKSCAAVAKRIATHVQAVEKSTTFQENSSPHSAVNRQGGRKKDIGRKSRLLLAKRIGQKVRHQYYPCSCSATCGDQCICKQRKTSCEKYCGCSKRCKNRFPGCQCHKTQCSSKFCPCFAASRECDPDVCRNCSPECGDVVTEETSEATASGEKLSKCKNMKILLKQKRTVLLARSDVSGWGLFLKDPANIHDYIGEYTGELISEPEAEKRGKIYDIINLSFLFDLNDKFVIDAYRVGSKFKFANHSVKPNCCAKIVKVAGEHRIAIYAKRRISSGEELFLDYLYETKLGDSAPPWSKNKKKFGNGLGSRRPTAFVTRQKTKAALWRKNIKRVGEGSGPSRPTSVPKENTNAASGS